MTPRSSQLLLPDGPICKFIGFHIFEVMKKAIALFFCLHILSGNAFSMELFKLPTMFQHYLEHERHEHPDLTFTAFLAEHYLSSHSDEADGHCDEKLPFKHCSDCCTHSSSVSSFVVPEAVTSCSGDYSEVAFRLSTETDIPVGYLDCIWQPPRIG